MNRNSKNKQFKNNSNYISSSKAGNAYNTNNTNNSNNMKVENANVSSTNIINNKENDIFNNLKKPYLPSPSTASQYHIKQENNEQSSNFIIFK